MLCWKGACSVGKQRRWLTSDANAQSQLSQCSQEHVYHLRLQASSALLETSGLAHASGAEARPYRLQSWVPMSCLILPLNKGVFAMMMGLGESYIQSHSDFKIWQGIGFL